MRLKEQSWTVIYIIFSFNRNNHLINWPLQRPYEIKLNQMNNVGSVEEEILCRFLFVPYLSKILV